MRKRNKGTATTTDTVVTTELEPTEVTEVVTETVEPTEVVEAVVTDEQRAEFDALQARRQELLAELGTIEGKLSAEYRNWTLMTSVVVKPVALCREVFLELANELGGVPQRKVVLDRCTSAGIAPNTAKTQYQVNKQKFERGEFAEQLSELEGLPNGTDEAE